ncbi:uncharacterized protein N7500_009097 [Penicillium coprophilum]|uniref:uncharacterized protein n=1 Tax=Penicillium coprophilum TaxID=36646 RepID=UPI0023A32DEF|nr:uncharacterized protein N7500_009097 [Penicillium coprophilum]KAJ5153658.1 hypothetical protein N7500_009097 [Penicillium coprophilum]
MMDDRDVFQINQPLSYQVGHAHPRKPVIIGLYGLPGSGKTFWLEELKTVIRGDEFAFYDGSGAISAVTPGGLEGFQNLTKEAKTEYRQQAIARIKRECCHTRKTAIVGGHFMFWPEEDEKGDSVCTPADLATYTHILYLDPPAELIAEYRLNDAKRIRPTASTSHLAKWKQTEKNELRDICRHHDILFAPIYPTLESVSSLICDFHHHTDTYNMDLAKQKMDEILGEYSALETVIVMDADKTLSQEDSGVLFWRKQVGAASTAGKDNGPLKSLFGGPLGYSYTSFRQATLLCEEAASDEEFEACCQDVSSMVDMHLDIVSVLQLVRETRHVRAVVVTCGIRSVWEKVLEREGLSETVKVIGGGRVADGLVITPSVKAELINYLQTTRHLHVIAFGDSPLDLAMLQAADQAVVVTGEESTRSKSMEKQLAEVIGKNGFQPCQVLLPLHAKPRLDTTRLPLVRLTDQQFINPVMARHESQSLRVLHATERSSAKLLMTPMRDASVSGPALREAHRRVGCYLGTELCTRIIGLESYPTQHVQGHKTDSYRLLDEKKTLIVPLMRGGEPMAFGVNDAFPLAMFHHARLPTDLQHNHLKDMVTIILVDSVVNSGKSVLAFVHHIRSLHGTIRIVVVAGVIHSQTVSTSKTAREFGRVRELSFVALRLSDNQFTGRGTTDTGNRLFNTVHLP